MAIQNVANNAYAKAMLEMRSQKVAQRGLRQTSNVVNTRHQESKGDFTSAIADSLKTVNDLQSRKHTMVQEFASGEKENVHELMITLQKAGLAMRMTSAVRNKVMEAYKELSHMSF